MKPVAKASHCCVRGGFQGKQLPEPKQISDSLKAWLVCTMANDKGQCFDLWVLIVEEKSDLKVGYFDITAAD